jgi:hypothetical protein
LATGLSGDEFRKSIDTMRTLIAQGLKDPKVMSKIAAVVEIMASADSHVVNRDILINLAAVYIVREDEDPSGLNPDIQAQKIDYLERHITEDPHAFFLQTSIEELKHLRELSPEELNRLWMASPTRIRAVTKMLDRFMHESGLHVLDPTFATN